MRYNLQSRGQQRPQRSPRHLERIKADQPEQADGDRILELGDKPVLKRAAGDAKMFTQVHALCLCISSDASAVQSGSRRSDREASQTRDYCVAKYATLRAARPDPSLRKERLLRDDNQTEVIEQGACF